MEVAEVPPAGQLLAWDRARLPEALAEGQPAFMELLPKAGARPVQVGAVPGAVTITLEDSHSVPRQASACLRC